MSKMNRLILMNSGLLLLLLTCSGLFLDSTICNSKTCCEYTFGRFHVCPFENGVCCPGRQDCCPQGFTCNPFGGCDPKYSSPLSIFSGIEERTIDATHRQSICSSTATECMLGSGKIGCCEHANAVCCEDRMTCCPFNYKCDLSTHGCVPSNATDQMINPQFRTDHVGVCSALEKSECPITSTCCKHADGITGCCGLANADCCLDGKHCCPQGTRCNKDSSNCDIIDDFHSPTRLMGHKPSVNSQTAGNTSLGIMCPDQRSECEDESTCCNVGLDAYACCPSANAVCCGDKKHCCPHGYTCDDENGSCKRNKANLLMTFTQIPNQSNSSVCGPKNDICGEQKLCRQLQNGEMGCCSKSELNCTGDSDQCCPKDHACKNNVCVKANLVKKLWSRSIRNVSCDRDSFCPSNSTCCKLPFGLFACCPLTNAVCCKDGLHCCPENTTCDLQSGLCIADKSVFNIHSLHTLDSVSGFTKSLKNIMCGVNHTVCDYGPNKKLCCPFKEATCCSDGFHCCPSNYTCKNNACHSDENLQLDSHKF